MKQILIETLRTSVKMNAIKTLRTQRMTFLLIIFFDHNGTSFSRGFILAKWNAFVNENETDLNRNFANFPLK
ncbi:hypothetical protein [Chryseobacterium sp. T20]|uniref:hypothetical protein n=1 Tax=Chryseobacterium sp. T20 TaxID=3395375 RepID=UPI0039BC6590